MTHREIIVIGSVYTMVLFWNRPTGTEGESVLGREWSGEERDSECMGKDESRSTVDFGSDRSKEGQFRTRELKEVSVCPYLLTLVKTKGKKSLPSRPLTLLETLKMVSSFGCLSYFNGMTVTIVDPF